MLNLADIKQEPVEPKQDPDSTTGNSPKKKPGRPKKLIQQKITDHLTVKKHKKVDRFKGMPENEVIARLLPDHLAPDLDIVIVGINPGLYAAFIGHHYAGPGNHFWKCMYLSGLIPEPMNAMQDFKLLDFGIGFTNIVARTTKGSADLTRKEIKEGAIILAEKLVKFKPKIVVFNGKGIYEVFVGHKNFHFGKQPNLLPGTETAVYVMPSSSARCSQLPRAVDKVPFYEALRKFRDHLNGKLPDLKESEITFPDLELKTAVKKEIKLEMKQEVDEEDEFYPDDHVENMNNSMPDSVQLLRKFVPGSYKVHPHTAVTTSSESQVAISLSSQMGTIQSQQHPSRVQHPIQVKLEPGVSECQVPFSFSSQSETFSFGHLEVYNQPNTSEQNDTKFNSCLNGLYGLVNQVANVNNSSSKYGIVTQKGLTNTGPVQFNDALCDIVRKGSIIDVDDFSDISDAHVGVVLKQPPEIALNKAPKTSKPRKRKSKTSSTVTSQQSAFPSQDQSISQSLSSKSSSPSNSQHSDSYQVMSSAQPFTKFTNLVSLPSYHMPEYSFAGLSQNSYRDHLQMGFPNFVQPSQSYSQMINNIAQSHEYPYMDMYSHWNTQMAHTYANGIQGQYRNIQSQSSGDLHPNIILKAPKDL